MGFDLGAEKFFDIKCQSAGLDTAAVVLVATVRALKRHGGVIRRKIAEPNPKAVAKGLPNLHKHIQNIRAFGEIPVVALNRFGTDTDEEVAVVTQACQEAGVPVAVSDHFERGGEGAMELARTLMEHVEEHPTRFKPLYDWSEPIEDKVGRVARTMYGASEVVYSKLAQIQIKRLNKLGYGELPVCIAKAPTSLTDDPRIAGRPEGFDVTVRSLELSGRRRFRHPAARRCDAHARAAADPAGRGDGSGGRRHRRPDGGLIPTVSRGAPARHVVLLHGLGRGPWSMALLARRLRQAGLVTHNLGYPSRPGRSRRLSTVSPRSSPSAVSPTRRESTGRRTRWAVCWRGNT